MAIRQILIAILLTGLAACASAGPSAPRSSTTFAADLQSKISEYQLGTGDVVRIIVFGEPDLSGEFSVDGAGYVSMPLVGEVGAQGQTVREFQKALGAVFRDGYLKDPRISVEVTSHRPYYILGEVGAPGEYAYQSGMTVLNAVASASGFTYRANKKWVFILRAGEAEEQKVPLTSMTVVQPGDVIRIGERFF